MIKINRVEKTQRSSAAMAKLVVLSVLLGSLSACTVLVVGGAVAGAAMVATDRRTSGAQLDDEGIEVRASSRLKEKFGERGHFNVTSFNRRVLLTGEVAGESDKLAAEQLVFQVDNVKIVVNELAVASMTSTLQQRTNDTYITGLVKASLLEAKDTPSSAFKVVTERNVVYLMGRVTSREADRGTDIARGVNGVTKVVRSFELISEEEAKR
jgi:osmotically-inducible protein OsmY